LKKKKKLLEVSLQEDFINELGEQEQQESSKGFGVDTWQGKSQDFFDQKFLFSKLVRLLFLSFFSSFLFLAFIKINK